MRILGVVTGWILLVAMTATDVSAAQLSLSSQTAAPGSNIVVPVSLSVQGAALTGIQFDLHYDSSAMSINAVLGDSGRNALKTLYFADISPDIRRFLIIGNNQTTLSDGILLVIYLNLRMEAAAGSYELSFTSGLTPVAADPDGSGVSLSSLSGYVAVQGTGAGSVPLQASGVLNAASLLPGPVAPGEFVTLLGSDIGPTSPQQQNNPGSPDLGSVQVWFDEVRAPLLYVSSGQINAIVPYAVSGKSVTHLQVFLSGQLRGDLTIPVAPAAPGLFTSNSNGAGQGAILNQDTSINMASQPAARGEIVTLYATGGGDITPAVDGAIISSTPGAVLPDLQSPVSVLIGATSAEILYAGPAPGLLSGALQINCRVPSNLPAGSVPVSIQVGSSSSQAGVTVALK
ncbi:MAG TPA: cohesin domain-containing protein [Bryobacteraceae bacterium]|nr:cohesin domain-containing protein [Bryobacteraceae bacterium]